MGEMKEGSAGAAVALRRPLTPLISPTWPARFPTSEIRSHTSTPGPPASPFRACPIIGCDDARPVPDPDLIASRLFRRHHPAAHLPLAARPPALPASACVCASRASPRAMHALECTHLQPAAVVRTRDTPSCSGRPSKNAAGELLPSTRRCSLAFAFAGQGPQAAFFFSPPLFLSPRPSRFSLAPGTQRLVVRSTPRLYTGLALSSSPPSARLRFSPSVSQPVLVPAIPGLHGRCPEQPGAPPALAPTVTAASHAHQLSSSAKLPTRPPPCGGPARLAHQPRASSFHGCALRLPPDPRRPSHSFQLPPCHVSLHAAFAAAAARARARATSASAARLPGHRACFRPGHQTSTSVKHCVLEAHNALELRCCHPRSVSITDQNHIASRPSSTDTAAGAGAAALQDTPHAPRS